MRLETPGGGGFGDPTTRDPDRVARDVELGYVSRDGCARDYGVSCWRRWRGRCRGDGGAETRSRPMSGVERSSASMSAAPSPTCSCSMRRPGRFRTAKVPSQRGDEAAGFLKGLHALGGAVGIGSIVHGTTVGTNTLLERRGPKIGVITTRGFRDVLEMRRRDRRRTWGLWGDFMPIADRDLRLEVDERTLADGSDPHAGR